MRVVITDDDGTVLEQLSIPLEFELDEVEACRNIVDLLERTYEVVEED